MIRFPYEWDELVSIHASPQRQGELLNRKMNRLIIMFQSTPHLSGKANNFFKQHGAYSFLVSIHASPQRQGELQGRELQAHKKGFQSTPHLSGKANKLALNFCRKPLMFQSTPHLSG